MAKIKNMKIGIKDDPSSFKNVKMKDGQGKPAFIQGKSLPEMKAADPDPCIRPAKIISRLKHNAILSYMGQGMILSPHGRRMINDYEKLGAIPSGITVVPVPVKQK